MQKKASATGILREVEPEGAASRLTMLHVTIFELQGRTSLRKCQTRSVAEA
jgi:hypothetical protein